MQKSMKYIMIISLSCLVTTTVFAKSLSANIILSHFVWSGTAKKGHLSIDIKSLKFSKGLTTMTISDNQDPTPLTIPIQIHFTSETNFILKYSNNGKPDPAMLNLNGKILKIGNSYKLMMSGTKKVYQQPKLVFVSLALSA